MPEPVELPTVQASPPASVPSQVRRRSPGTTLRGGEAIWVDSGMPWLMAAARVNALNVEPAWKPLASPYFAGTT